MEKHSTGMVIIYRHSGDYQGSEYAADKIKNVHWGRVSGGVKKAQNGFSLYGYIPYSDAMDIVACSDRHDYGYNDAKICITATTNKDNPKYRAAYYGLVEKADEKASCGIAAHCPNGQPSCTKKIREILYQKGKIYRCDLKAELIQIGYRADTIQEAINNLHFQEVLVLEGNYQNPHQIVRLK